jgi:Cu/Ag efflux protein CusF
LLWVTEGRAADTHEGKVVETSSGKLTMTDTAGKNQHTMQIPATATVMRDGKTAMLTDLKPGDMITVTTEKTGDTTAVTKIEATPSGS